MSVQNFDGGDEGLRAGLSIFSGMGCAIGKTDNEFVMDEYTLKLSHDYIIFNCDEVIAYLA